MVRGTSRRKEHPGVHQSLVAHQRSASQLEQESIEHPGRVKAQSGRGEDHHASSSDVR